MGALASASNALSLFGNLAGLGFDFMSSRQESQHRSRMAAAENANARAEAREAESALRASREEDRRRTQAALRREMARRRAQLGSAGVDIDGGSGEAILLGVVDEARLANDASDRETDARIDQLRRRASHNVRTNLLEANNRNRLSSFDLFSSALSTGLDYLGDR